MYNFCLLTSMEQILTTKCSLLYLHSNDMKSFSSLEKGKSIAINIIVIKCPINMVSM